MKESMIERILEFLKRHLVQTRWRRAATCLAALVVFCTTYFLMLPAISMTKHTVTLGAEKLSAWSGDPLSVRVDAHAEEDEDGKIFVLVSNGAGAELSETYVFDEDGICVITDEEGREIELHRTFRADKKAVAGEDITADYWFSLGAGEQTAFTLQLSDEVDEERFLRAAEAVKSAAEGPDAAAGQGTERSATGSDADRREEKQKGKEQDKATGSDGQRAASVPFRAASVSDAVKAEETEEEDGFVQLLDGEILNDLAEDEADEDGEPTETVAYLVLSAGSGKDYETAVRDAEKNAEKRGDGRLKFIWKDIAERVYITPEMVWTGDGAQVAVIFDGDAKLPADAVLSVEEIEPGSPEYEVYLTQAVSVVRASGSDASKEMGVDYARFFDICILDGNGNELEPAAPVKVVITYDEAVSVGNGGDLSVMHFHEENVPEVLEAEKNGILRDIPAEKDDESTAGISVDVDALSFTAEKFSVFGVVRSAIEKLVLASDGQTYRVSVSCGAGSGVPEGAELAVSEILEGESVYREYAERAEAALGLEEGSASFLRLFDIKILDLNGEKVEISAPVDVKISLADTKKGSGSGKAGDVLGESAQVLHFPDGAEQPDVVSEVDIADDGAEGNGVTLSFAAEGFSVYAIVDAPEPAKNGIQTLKELAALVGADAGAQPPEETAFYLSYDAAAPKYFTNELSPKDCFVETSDIDSASEWCFEPVDLEGNKYRIYTYTGTGKQYILNTSGNLVGLTAVPGTLFKLSQAADGLFYFQKDGKDLWLQHSNGGGGIRFWNANDDDKNSRIMITFTVLPYNDPYSLGGKSYGIAYHDNRVVSAALTAKGKTVTVDSVSQQRLEAEKTVMKPDVRDNDGILLVAQDSEIRQWTFSSIGQDNYHITTSVDGQTKYLTINGANVTLEDIPDPQNSVVRAVPGTGANAGKWHFTVNGYSLNLPDGADKGFNASNGSKATTWMNLVEKTTLADDAFTPRLAKKVSVSDDTKVYDKIIDGKRVKSEVVLYTRVWNKQQGKYEFFVVDHNGTLIPCYDNGDTIEWISGETNTSVWQFTEGKNGDTLTYYYWLENTAIHDHFLVPHSQVIYVTEQEEDFSASVNLVGRRFGENFTTIIAWDDDRYSFTGLKCENGRVIPCALSDADDFYFAIMTEAEPGEEKVTKVTTVDSDAYGISMRMIDYDYGNVGTDISPRDKKQKEFFGGDNNNPGLLTTYLVNGYPLSTEVTGNAGNSLRELYDPEKTKNVNHLFIESTYNESGYFEYNSTSNFAHLNEDGTFTVYDQLGSIGDYGFKPTGTHGQFMPYDNIVDIADGQEIPKAHCDFTNQTDVLANPLPDANARKGEALYNIGDQRDVNYQFGMEMSASFTQTANGLDAWEHDIVFEFSGDDDFWLYVDNELVLDLGGVHPAMTGSINFRTGEVKSGRALELNTKIHPGKRNTYTLREIFESNYRNRYPDASDQTVQDYLDEHFKPGTSVFKDYSIHEMKMFYMERGAGASNLHMRFNLAAVKKGTVELSKKLSGAVSESNSLIEFPYQIYYTYQSDGGELEHLLTKGTEDAWNVVYKDSITPVKYQESKVIEGKTYKHVFLLKPGETAVINLPEDTLKYYIVECGVDTEVYDEVKVNVKEDGSGEPEHVTPVGEGTRQDFRIDPAATKDRPKVVYDNHLKGKTGTLSFTKKLYDADGDTPLVYPDNKTPFKFRLYLGNEYVDTLTDKHLAYLYSYYLKDPEGNYCRWDKDGKEFVSLGIKDYAELLSFFEEQHWTEEEKATVIFKTSMNGSVSSIPAGYTVEVRDLVIGTKWKVEEWEDEIPKGYTMRIRDGYTRIVNETEVPHGTEPVSGTIGETVTVGSEEIKDTDPKMEVRNQKGWGLTAEKVWTDKDYMDSHDDIYFAVYIKVNGKDELYPGSVRKLASGEKEIYYFFDDLKYGEDSAGRVIVHDFSDFSVREVILTDPVTDADGNITYYRSITPIDNGGTLNVGGTPAGGTHQDNISYTVTYTVGESTGHNENVRHDTVTNSRPGIRFIKEDWTGNALPGAVFNVAEGTGSGKNYTSGNNGLITIAELKPGTITLTETGTPRGYIRLDVPAVITVNQQNTITIGGVSSEYFQIEQASEENHNMATVIIRNRTVGLQVKKADAQMPDKMIGDVHFALYRQTGGQQEYDPVPGYEDLVTNEEGLLRVKGSGETWRPFGLDDLMRDTTYYLKEKRPAGGYEPLPVDLCFTFAKDGTVTVNNAEYRDWIRCDTDLQAGHALYTITVLNEKIKKVSFKKVDVASPGSALKDAVFDLYKVKDGQRIEPALMTGLRSDETGMLKYNGEEVFELRTGTYQLVETSAPEYYVPLSKPVEITINENAPSYNDGTSYSQSGEGISTTDLSDGTTVYTLKICNSRGVSLPATGGPGTRAITFCGVLLTAAAGALLLLHRRQRLVPAPQMNPKER